MDRQGANASYLLKRSSLRGAISLFFALLILWASPVRGADSVLDWRKEAAQAFGRGDYAKAEELYRRIIDRGEGDFLIYHRLGLIYLWQGEWQEAVSHLKQALALEPRDVPTLLALAQAFLGREDTETARAYFGKALEIDPGNFEARIGMARALTWSLRYDEARAIYEDLLETTPSRPEPWTGLGELALWKGDLESAQRQLLRALEIDPQNREARRILDLALEKIAQTKTLDGKYREAETLYRELLSRHPERRSLRLDLAKTLSWTGEYDAAIGEYDRWLEEHPTDGEAILAKARVLSWAGRFDESEEAYQQVLALNPEASEAWLGLATLDLWQDRLGQALVRGEKALRFDPENEEAKRLLRRIRERIRPSVDLSLTHYEDEDGNRINTFRLVGHRFVTADLRFSLTYGFRLATDPDLTGRAHRLVGAVDSRINDRFSAHASLGVVSLDRDVEGQRSRLVGSGGISVQRSQGLYGVSVSQDVLTDTATLIENDVRLTSIRFTGYRPFGDRWHLYGGLGWGDLSDGNTAFDLYLSPMAVVRFRHPRVKLGYRFAYRDFEKQTHSGYFDPNDFHSHEAVIQVEDRAVDENHGYDRWFYRVEGGLGYQWYRRFGDSFSDPTARISGTAGIRLSDNLAGRAFAEYGNSALGTAAGFAYWQFGMALTYLF